MFTAALIQSCMFPHNLDGNLKHYEKLLSENIHGEVDLIVLPEVFNCGFSPDIFEITRHDNGRSVEFLKEVSVRYNCAVAATLPVFEHNVLYNRLLWVSSSEIVAYYDKFHLFMGEEKYFSRGGRRTVVEHSGYRFLPLICFDVRFPEWCRNSITDGMFGYDCIVLPTNFPSRRIDELKVLACARAVENQCYVLVTNRTGRDGFGTEYCGGTFVADPHGRIVAELPPHEEGVMVHNCDFDYLKVLRKEFPVSEYWRQNQV